MTKNIGSGTAQGLVEYLDNIVTKGKATSGAIVPLKTAFTKVMEAVDGGEWPQTQVDSINVEDYVNRFANLTRGAYTEASIVAYKSRMNRVINWYKKFMAQPGWMPVIQTRTPKKKPNNQVDSSHAADSASFPGVSTNEAYAPARTLPSGIMVVFPKHMDAQVSFGSFGEELRNLDKKGMEFAVGGERSEESRSPEA